jgi:hypothetical protein
VGKGIQRLSNHNLPTPAACAVIFVSILSRLRDKTYWCVSAQ